MGIVKEPWIQRKKMVWIDVCEKINSGNRFKKEEVYIGGKETYGVLIKRFFQAYFENDSNMKVT